MASQIIPVMDADFTARDPTRSTIQQLIDQHLVDFKEALVKRVTTEFQHQGQLLEEAKQDLVEARRDLEAYRRAFSTTERDRRDLEERSEREKQALNDEIRQLKERGMPGREEWFEQAKQALNDGILQLRAIVTREKRAVYQQNAPPVSADTQQHAMVRDGTKVA